MARYFNLDDPGDAYGKTDFDFFSAEHARQAQADERAIIDSGSSILGIEEKETWPDGHTTWVSTSKNPLRDATGRIIGIFGISRDITARKEAEARAARYADELKQANDTMLADLALAGELQAALLPAEYPAFPLPGRDSVRALNFAHVYQPSQLVGGDFFSVLPIAANRAAIFLCDGIGHGVRAALLASILSALFRERIRNANNPADCLTQIDRELHALLQRHPDIIFATALCLTMEPETGSFQCANAGHLPPFILRKASGTIERLAGEEDRVSPAIGLVQGARFHVVTGNLAPGDRMVLFTDGLVEVANVEADQFGEERLAAALHAAAAQPIQEMLKAALQAARAFSRDGEFDDDVCALCIERTDPGTDDRG
jgi:sigma-B regulation protein RsbU (phosphoserine phosphatase)